MRKDFETPNDFNPLKEVNGHKIEYFDLREIAQGSPLIGKIKIDSITISEKDYFGGPFVYDDEFIYIPIYQRSFFNTGFKLVKISLLEKKIIKLNTKIKPLYFLINIENRIINYCETHEGLSLKQFNIN